MPDKLSSYRHTMEARYVNPQLTPDQAKSVNDDDIDVWLLYGYVRAAEARQLSIYNDYLRAKHKVRGRLEGGDE